MPRIRVQYVSRNSVTGSHESGGGFLDESELFNFPYWLGNPGPTYQEILIHFQFQAEKKKQWLCYFRPLKPDRKSFSAPDEKEEYKEYVDQNAYVMEYTPKEADDWFRRHGLEAPPKSKEHKHESYFSGRIYQSRYGIAARKLAYARQRGRVRGMKTGNQWGYEISDVKRLWPKAFAESNLRGGTTKAMKIDVFISHASEDKETIARPLAERLRSLGYEVWYDNYVLKLGDNLRQEIDRGLAECAFGVVILSKAFFKKHFPKQELDGLAARESIGGKKIILPVWHEITAEDVAKFSPTLANKIAVSSSRGIDHVVEKIVEVLGPPNQAQSASGTSPPRTAEAKVPSTGIVNVDQLLDSAVSLVRQKNLPDWRRLIRRIREEFPTALLDVRRRADAVPYSTEVRETACEGSALAVTPLVVASLSALEGELEAIRDQRWVLEEIRDVHGWNRGGSVAMIDLINVPPLIWHHLIGSFLVHSRRQPEAADLLSTTLLNSETGNRVPLWQAHPLMGCGAAFSLNCWKSWEFLVARFSKIPWLAHFFDSEKRYISALRAYQCIGSVVEVADYIRAGGTEAKIPKIDLDVYPIYLRGFNSAEDFDRLVREAIPNAKMTETVAGAHGISASQMRGMWQAWLTHLVEWQKDISRPFFDIDHLFRGRSLPSLP